MKGIEPLASRMQSARSTPELHPPSFNMIFFSASLLYEFRNLSLEHRHS